MFNINQVSEQLDISASTIRKYEKEYDLNIKRDDHNKRVYSDKDLEAFKRIMQLKKTSIKNFINSYCKLLKIKGVELSAYMGKSHNYVSRNVQLRSGTINKAESFKNAFIDMSDKSSDGEQILYIDRGDIFLEDN